MTTKTQKAQIELLTPAQMRVIVNAYRFLAYQDFFMVVVTLEPFVSEVVGDELNFLVLTKLIIKRG